VKRTLSASWWSRLLRDLDGLSRQQPDTAAGSTRQIDYGGREVDDVFAVVNRMLGRVTISRSQTSGYRWSHGGLITVDEHLQHAATYAVAYAAFQ